MKCDGGPSQKKTRQLVGVPYILAQSGEGVSRPLCLCSCWSLALALLPKDIHSFIRDFATIYTQLQGDLRSPHTHC